MNGKTYVSASALYINDLKTAAALSGSAAVLVQSDFKSLYSKPDRSFNSTLALLRKSLDHWLKRSSDFFR